MLQHYVKLYTNLHSIFTIITKQKILLTVELRDSIKAQIWDDYKINGRKSPNAGVQSFSHHTIKEALKVL